ncbi:Serine/threonine-protein phosphatase 7 long form-like [Senna tora]|uniref:Serine/threonine-protein phosphatase 7 long form-like n=1 Tax=Senna tora TaxID=362788 RepID=A0A834ST96_9FABA|nr:Serine/threonine-protein phosphatase 7 long form-like [Senna tora]
MLLHANLPDNLGEFSDEDEYEASVPIRMTYQDEEYDNVGEDVFEEELANFYSQVDMEGGRGFTGDLGPRSEDVGELYEGMKFPTKVALRRHVKLYHIKNNCTFAVVKSGSNFKDWRCPKFGKECAWRLRAMQKYGDSRA